MPIERPTLRIDWRFAIGQVILIAVGVMFGLAGNAWWSGRQDRERERASLGNALDAARMNERRLRQSIFEDSTSWAINTNLLGILRGKGVSPIGDDSVLVLYQNGGWWSDGRPIVSPFAALQQTGDLNLVRNEKLRAMLASYVGEIDTRLAGQNELSQIWQRMFFEMPAVYYAVAAPTPPQMGAAIRRDVQVRRVLLTRRGVGSNIVSNERIMLRYTTELRTALERELQVASVPLPSPRIRRDSF